MEGTPPGMPPPDRAAVPGGDARADALRVVVGLSGGVDSAVAAALLVREGYRVEGLFMKNWDDDDGTEYCTAARDLIDAEAVAHRLGIPLHTVSFARAYRERVFAEFLAEYRAGRTPNPDVLCNREIKFAVFRDHAASLGADRIATGHYARVRHGPEGPRLLRAADEGKDQTYFLQAVRADQLRDVLFPLGDWHKRDVRAFAHSLGLHVGDKKDSTGICFIGERRFSEFLARYVQGTEGPIVDVDDGRTLARHRGLPWYTIGQRQGLGIGGRRGAAEAPWYVVGKDPAGNRLLVAQGRDHPALFAPALETAAPTWIGPAPADGARVQVRIRHRQPLQGAVVRSTAGGSLRLTFDRPQRAVAPGQWACFYDGGTCLGGAVIDRALDAPRGGAPGSRAGADREAAGRGA
jgi:tRNA-specific 2-thiouridylase